VKVWLAKKGRGFLPTDEESNRVHVRMSDGECALFKVIRVRSVPWHKMYFGICREIGKNQDPQRSEDSIDAELRIRAGHFDPFEVDGHKCRMPKRIAFDQLTADEWAELWPSLELAIREHFGEEYIGEQRMAG
jgi:hypothetical protein